MVNQPHVFKHRDVTRLVKAARAAGIDANQVTVDPRTGAITVSLAGQVTSKSDLDNVVELAHR